MITISLFWLIYFVSSIVVISILSLLFYLQRKTLKFIEKNLAFYTKKEVEKQDNFSAISNSASAEFSNPGTPVFTKNFGEKEKEKDLSILLKRKQ